MVSLYSSITASNSITNEKEKRLLKQKSINVQTSKLKEFQQRFTKQQNKTLKKPKFIVGFTKEKTKEEELIYMIKQKQTKQINSIENMYNPESTSVKSSAIRSENPNKITENIQNNAIYTDYFDIDNKRTEEKYQKQYMRKVDQINEKVSKVEKEADKLIEDKDYQNTQLRIKIAQLQQSLYAIEQEQKKEKKKYMSLEKNYSQNISDYKNNKKLNQSKQFYNKPESNLQNYNEQLMQNKKENKKLRQCLNRQLLKNQHLQQQLLNMKDQYKKLQDQIRLKSILNPKNNYNLKKQVQQLSRTVEMMQAQIKNCPSCLILSKQNEGLRYSKQFLEKQLIAVRRHQGAKQANFLDELQQKTDEINNIRRKTREISLDCGIREVYQRAQRKPLAHRNKQSVKDSVAKRCRTLTESFYQ